MGLQKELQENIKYWEQILGKEICESIHEDEIHEGWSDEYKQEYQVLQNDFDRVLQVAGGWDACMIDMPFSAFYGCFGKIAITYAMRKDLSFLRDIKETILPALYNRIIRIPLRVLVQDIHKCKDAGLLKGGDEKEEYVDYCKRFLERPEYIRQLCEAYPEMKKLLLMQILNLVLYLEEIVTAAQKDKEQLEQLFFQNGQFSCIDRIVFGQSDAHRLGRTVARVYFDQGQVLIYKPRSLCKETRFEELYESFCKEAQLSYMPVPVLDRGTYGWQTCVETKKCQDQEAVKRYFERMGVLLFLCYCMSAGDIHGENIIAAGEYPVLIDLEAFPGIWKHEQPDCAEAMVREELRASVLSTGILPVTMWHHEGHGVILNALHGKKKELTPFQVPVLMDAGTSNIHIGYQRGEIHLGDSLPSCDGLKVNPADYTRELCRGFQKAYQHFLKNIEAFKARMELFFEVESRHLLRHTQQYSMLLQTSFYPDFLESEEKRRLFFYTLDKHSMNEKQKERFLPYERNALYHMDIPIYSMKGTGRALYDGAGKMYPEILKDSARELWRIKLGQMGDIDMKRQIRYIELSLALLAEYQEEKPKPDDKDCLRCVEQELLDEKKAGCVKAIADKICDLASIYDGQDISFSGLHFQDEKNWSIAPAGLYLYDGMSGVAVFLAAAKKCYPNSRYTEVWRLLVQKMFRYTDWLEHGGKPESAHVGAYVGEGSLVYAYLLLYEITGEVCFLEYAKRHSEVLVKLVQNEEAMDLLSGLAGAIVVLLKLYEITKEACVLSNAKQLEEKLWKHMEPQEIGYGWRLNGLEHALAGMAHGNSGILLAYAALYKADPLADYQGKIQELLRYEESLFDEETRNWLDLRHDDGVRTSSNAWCHGASGILLARLKLREIEALPEDIKAQVERDIERCLCIFRKGRDTQEVCLCHGHAGDYGVLHRYASLTQDPELLVESRELLVRLLEKLDAPGDLRVQERENISLMTGMAGVGMALLGY